MSYRLAALSLLGLALAHPALASDPAPASPDAVVAAPVTTAPSLVFSLRGGVATAPAYFGADDYTVGPDLGFRFHALTLKSGRTIGNPDPWADKSGLTFGGSFRFVGERDASEHDDLTGLDDVDAAVELGVSVGYATRNFETFADLRRGFGGHEGWVAELGADVVARPSSRWRLSAGPRLLWGDNSYSDTYFGVTAAEATAALPAYNPDGGLVSAGIEIGARYQINDTWGVEGAITWDTFMNDAADSPIVDQGASEQWGARLGVTRVFRIGG